MPLDSELGPVKIYSPAETGKPWRVVWKLPGQSRKVKDRKTKTDAVQLARDIKGQIKRGEIGQVHRITDDDARLLELCKKLRDPERTLTEAIEREKEFERVTVAACVEQYINEYQERENVMTRRDAETKAGVIRETLGERYLDSLTEGDIEEWRDKKLKGSPRYRNNILSHLRHLFQRAKVWGYVPKGHNPAREVPNLKIAKKEPEVWLPEDFARVMKWYQDPKRKIRDIDRRIVFLALGAFAGMRVSEIEGVHGERDGLLWEDIDFENRHIHIRPEVAGKLAEPRYISFTERTNSGFSEEIADMIWNTLTSWLLPYQKESGPVTLRKCQLIVSPELKEADVIDAWPKNGLRHTWISSMLALGVHREWVAELAGNSPEMIRTNYKRPLPKDVAESWFTTSSQIFPGAL